MTCKAERVIIMNIRSIKIQNFRGFESFEAQIHPQLTVVVGNNGAGKSSFLDALSISVGTFFSGLDGVTCPGIHKDDVTCKSFEMGSVVDLQQQYPSIIEATGRVDGQEISWIRALHSSTGRTTTVDAKALVAVAEEHQKQIRSGSTETILPLISYYGTGRLWAQKKEKRASDELVKFSRLNGYLDCLAAESNEKLMLKWFEKMTIQQAQRATPSPELTAVKRAISKCFANITEASDVETQFNLDTHSLDIVYTDKNGNKLRSPMKNLSDGYKNTLGMIADIAYRMAVLNPQLLDDVLIKTPGIVLIDEIDLHLHPKWQQRIIKDLQSIFPCVQFVVSTHAPAVISSVKKENLIVLKDDGSAYAQAVEIYGKDANSILTGVMDVEHRPAEIQREFDRFYEFVDAGDFEMASDIVDALERTIGTEDPELVKARVTLALEGF